MYENRGLEIGNFFRRLKIQTRMGKIEVIVQRYSNLLNDEKSRREKFQRDLPVPRNKMSILSPFMVFT